MNIQGLFVIPLAFALFASHIDVRQKMHFDQNHPITGTHLATPALDVEGKSTRLVTAHLRFRCGGEQVADISKDASIGGGVRTRGSPDGRLVDIDDFVDIVEAQYLLVLPILTNLYFFFLQIAQYVPGLE